MGQARADEIGVHMINGEALVQTCHDMLNAASVLLANVEFLANAAVGSNAERESAATDAVDSIKRLADQIRGLQESARQRSHAA
jgi:hypothetical protein